jgi:amino acid transporter
MTTAVNPPVGTLKRAQLGYAGVVAQAIGTIAPSGSPALVTPAVFATAGNGTWLAYGFATIALLVLALNINVFARRSASPGALFTFTGQSLGPFWGAVSGWALIIAYLFTGAAVIAGSVNYVLVVLHPLAGNFPDGPAALLLSVLSFVGIWAIAWRSILLSTRVSLIFEGITIALILVVLAAGVIHNGDWVDTPQLRLVDVTFDKVRIGLVLAFFSFVGFESATVLGHEAHAPLRLIPRSVIATVLAVGVFFVVSAYALLAAFQGMEPGLDKSDAPISALALRSGLGLLGPVVAAGVAASFFASALASVNAAARIIYAFSHHGILPVRAGHAHHVNATPHIAVGVASTLVLALALAGQTLCGGLLDAFGTLASIATFGFLVAYILVSVGAPVYLQRRGELGTRHMAASAASVVLLAVPVVGILYPVPPFPQNILPYVFGALLAAGVLHFLWIRQRSPGALALVEADLERMAGEPAATPMRPGANQ